MSDFLWTHGLQHARLLCPSLSSGVCSNSCPLSQWCYLTISSSATFCFCLQSFPASGSFPVSQLSLSSDQSIGASASVHPVNVPLGLTGFISLKSKDSQGSSQAPQFESISFLALSLIYGPALTSVHDHWKNHSFDYTDIFFGKVLSLLFIILPRFAIVFLPRSKCVLISWLQSQSIIWTFWSPRKCCPINEA